MAKKPQGIDLNASFEAFKEKLKETDLNVYFIFGAIALILIVGVYALFSAETQSAGNPACGKIVIAANGRSLASSVAPTLQEAKYFLVVDPLTGKMIESVKNPYMGGVPDPQIAYLVAGKGEEAVIVNSIDQQSYNILMQFGIRVFGGYQGRSQKVLKLYRQARIAPSQQPMMNVPQQSPMMQAQAMPVNMQPVFQGQQQMGMNMPNCPLPYANQQGVMQGNMQPVFQGQQMGMNMPNCPLPYNNMQGGTQVGMQNGMGMYQPNCPLPYGMQGGGMQNQMVAQGATQAAFGIGQQAFICPNCNWRMNAMRQGNNFPYCPNCGSPMALNNNTGWNLFAGGQQAAMAPAQFQPQMNQMNQMNNQQNFWAGPDSNKFFICPNCNWRMYSQVGNNEFPRCPNCGQIMARGGVYQSPMGQNIQNNGAMAQVAAVAPQMAQAAPPIPANAMMPHPNRGACTNCHQILPASALLQNNAVPDPNVAHMAIGRK